MTCATLSMRCSTFRTLGASGVSCPTSLVPGRGSGPSFAGGRGTGRGSGFSPHCTRRHAPPLVDKTRSPRWWSSTPISHEEHRTEGTFHNQGSLWSNQRGQANRLRGRHRSATLRESCLPRRAKHGPSNSYSRNSRAWGLTNASNSCSWTAGPRSQPPVDSRNGSAARFAASGGTSHLATSTAPRSFARSVTPGGSKSPMATSCAADGWPAASRTPWRQPPDGCTLLQ